MKCCLGTIFFLHSLGFKAIQFIDTHHHKPIFYPSIFYDGSNATRIMWSGDQVGGFTTQFFFEYHQDVDNEIILNWMCYASVIIYMIIVAAV